MLILQLVDYKQLHKVWERLYWSDIPLTAHVDPDLTLYLQDLKPSITNIDEETKGLFYQCYYVFMSFIAALECSNVFTVDNNMPDKLNKSRVKKGKRPFFTYKTLVVDKEKALRRGSIDLLSKNKVWVNALLQD